jgi:hypothetical protein
MHPIWQAPQALKRFARELKEKYGCSFKVRQSSGNSMDDVSRTLQEGKLVIVHGLWLITDPKESLYKFGGGPHTMLVVGVDTSADKISFLNPAYPHPETINPDDPSTFPQPALDEMTIQEFIQFWGRKSLLNLYTRPYTMTVIIPDEKDL